MLSLSQRKGGTKTDKDLRKIVKAFEAKGFKVAVTKRGHVIVTRDGQLISAFAGTASDWRLIRSSLAPLKRAGFRWPPTR